MPFCCVLFASTNDPEDDGDQGGGHPDEDNIEDDDDDNGEDSESTRSGGGSGARSRGGRGGRSRGRRCGRGATHNTAGKASKKDAKFVVRPEACPVLALFISSILGATQVGSNFSIYGSMGNCLSRSYAYRPLNLPGQRDGSRGSGNSHCIEWKLGRQYLSSELSTLKGSISTVDPCPTRTTGYTNHPRWPCEPTCPCCAPI